MTLLQHVPFPPAWQCRDKFRCHGWKSAHPLGRVVHQPAAFGLEAEQEKLRFGIVTRLFPGILD